MIVTENATDISGPQMEQGNYDRPRLEDFLDDTIPTITRIDTEVFFRRVADETLDCIKPEYGPLVVDVASGMGMDSCALCKRGFKMIAIEPQKDMVGYVRFHHEEHGQYAMYLRGYAEELPLADNCTDQLLCKGSLDHFLDPRVALAEMRRVLKPGGRFIVSAANYDSLSCYCSKAVHRVRRLLYGPPIPGSPRPPHEIPTDHITRFNTKILRNMVEEFFEVKRVIGIGMLWGVPYLNNLWENLSPKTAEKAIERLYDTARYLPSLADMAVLDCIKP